MEIRCEECEHVGPAARVVPIASGVELVCANCGHHNALSVGEPQKRPPPIARSAPAERSGEVDASWLKAGALERLVPETGDGPRCRKCAQLLRGADNCSRCGLDAREAERYPPGEEPWERAPESVDDGSYEQATLLWKTVEENPTDDNLTKFVNFSRDEDLLEYSIRRLRFFLVDHPHHARASEHLVELAESFQAQMIVARAKAEVRADNIEHATGRIRRALLWMTFVIFTSIFLLFAVQVLSG